MVLTSDILVSALGLGNANTEAFSPNKRSRCVVLSPHADDAALSVGGVMASFGPEVDCWLVSLTGGPLGDENSTWDRRRLEDRRFALSLGCRHIECDLLDARLRSNKSVVSGQPRPEDVSAVRSLLSGIMLDLVPNTVFAPLGAGGHVDHLAVAESILSLFVDETIQRSTTRVLFYEDLPYVAKEPAELEGRINTLRHNGWILHPHIVDVSGVFERKMEGIAIYETQRPVRWEAAIFSYASSTHGAGGTAERLWELAGP